jgi:hypothetical protein
MDKIGSFTGPSNSKLDDKLKIFGSLVSTSEFAPDGRIEGSFEIPLQLAPFVNLCFLLGERGKLELSRSRTAHVKYVLKKSIIFLFLLSRSKRSNRVPSFSLIHKKSTPFPNFFPQ